MNINPVIIKIAKIITPCTICILICIYSIINTALVVQNNGWENLFYIILGVAIFALAICTLITHLIFKNKIWFIWLAELVVIGLVILFN